LFLEKLIYDWYSGFISDNMNKKYFLILGLVLVFLFSACTQTEEKNETELNTQQAFNEEIITQTNDLNLPEIVAIIDGEEITNDQILQYLYLMELPENQESISEVINQIATRKVLLNEANRREYSIDLDEVESHLRNISEMDIEEIKNIIETQGLDYSEFLEEQKEEMIFFKLVDEEIKNQEITEEEIKEFYEFQFSGMQGSPDYDEVSEEIKDFLAEQKAYDSLSNLAEKLISEINIELFI